MIPAHVEVEKSIKSAAAETNNSLMEITVFL